MEASWIDVVLNAAPNVIKRTPTIRDDVFFSVQDRRKEIWNWHFSDEGEKMHYRKPTMAKDFKSLGRKSCKLKEAVYEIVVKMYDHSVRFQNRLGLNEGQTLLFRDFWQKKLEYESSKRKLQRMKKEVDLLEIKFNKSVGVDEST